MNGKDKEAFEEWLRDASNHYADALAYEFERHLCFVSWQAACEYVRDDFKFQTPPAVVAYMEINDKLQAENKKLRQELEIAKSIFREEGFDGAADDIEEALKEDE